MLLMGLGCRGVGVLAIRLLGKRLMKWMGCLPRFVDVCTFGFWKIGV